MADPPVQLETAVPTRPSGFRPWADFPNLVLINTFQSVFRDPFRFRRWTPDPTGISSQSQAFFQNNLLDTTLKSKDQIYGAAGEAVPNYDWPHPPPTRQPDRFWAQNLVLTTLLSKDARLAGTQFTVRPREATQPDRGWAASSPIALFPLVLYPFNQYSWPNPTRALQPDRTWLQNLVPTTLAGQDASLAGDAWWERPLVGPIQWNRGFTFGPYPTLASQDTFLSQPRQSTELPRGPFRPDSTFTFQINLSLLGQDNSLAGQQFYDRPRTAIQPDRSFGSSPTPLFAFQPYPFNQYDWPLPTRPAQPAQTWLQNLVCTTLAGQDASLTGEAYFDRPPMGPYQFNRTWATGPNPNLSGQDLFLRQPRQFTERPLGPYRPDSTFTFQINLNLLGQDASLAGAQRFERPPNGPQPDRGWVWSSPSLIYSFVAFPFNQYDWALPRIAPQPDRTWIQNLVLGTLAGQDNPLAGVQWWERPRAAIQPDRGFGYSPTVLFSFQPYPFNQYDWPLPVRYVQPDRYWFQTLVGTVLAGQDATLTGEQLWERPAQGPYQFNRGLTFGPNLTLAGQDQFLSQPRQFSELPRQPFRPDRAFYGPVNLNLVGQDLQPLNQLNWPLPTLGARPDRSFVFSLSQPLVGPPELLFIWGRRSIELPRQLPAGRTFINQVNLTLFGQDLRPTNQLNWPNPIQPRVVGRSFDQPGLTGLRTLVVVFPVNQYNWPLPISPYYDTSLRTAIASLYAGTVSSPGPVIFGPSAVQRYFAGDPQFPQITGAGGYLINWRKQ